MATKSEKMTKQELRAPDAFQRVGGEAQSWLRERQNVVGIAALVLLLGGLGGALFSYLSQRGEERASKALGGALMLLQRPVVEGAADSGGEDAPFKSAKEKDEALKSALTEVRTQHGGTRAAVAAALTLGNAELRLGNHEAALAAFGEYLGKTSKEDLLRAEALEGQGYAYELQGKYDQALTAFEQMARETTGEFLQGMGQYHQARMLALLDRKEEAARMFADLKDAKANTAAGRAAAERLALLESQGVKAPPPASAATSQDAG